MIPKLQLLVSRSYYTMTKGLSLQESSSCYLPFYQNRMVKICFIFWFFSPSRPMPTYPQPLCSTSLPWTALANMSTAKMSSLDLRFVSHFAQKPRKTCHTVHIRYFFFLSVTSNDISQNNTMHYLVYWVSVPRYWQWGLCGLWGERGSTTGWCLRKSRF